MWEGSQYATQELVLHLLQRVDIRGVVLQVDVLSPDVLVDRRVVEEGWEVETHPVDHVEQEDVGDRLVCVVVDRPQRAERVDVELEVVEEACPNVQQRDEDLHVAHLPLPRDAIAAVRLADVAFGWVDESILEAAFEEVVLRHELGDEVRIFLIVGAGAGKQPLVECERGWVRREQHVQAVGALVDDGVERVLRRVASELRASGVADAARVIRRRTHHVRSDHGVVKDAGVGVSARSREAPDADAAASPYLEEATDARVQRVAAGVEHDTVDIVVGRGRDGRRGLVEAVVQEQIRCRVQRLACVRCQLVRRTWGAEDTELVDRPRESLHRHDERRSEQEG